LLHCTPNCKRAEAGYNEKPGDFHPRDKSGEPLDQITATRIAAFLLAQARSPLVILSDEADSETARRALSLARKFDLALILDDRGTRNTLSLSMKSAGLLTATIGEIRASASQLLVFDLDPEMEMPRFWDFMTKEQKLGAIHIAAANPLNTIQTLRLALRKNEKANNTRWHNLPEKITSATSGAVLIGDQWLRAGVPLLTELFLWLKELNQIAHWYGLPCTSGPNSLGLSEVLLSETGYPGSLRFIHGQAEYSPYELQIELLLRQKLVDVVLMVGSPRNLEPACFDSFAQQGVKRIQISSDPPQGPCDLWFPCTKAGLDTYGEMLRLDAVPVHLQPVISSERLNPTRIISCLMNGENE